MNSVLEQSPLELSEDKARQFLESGVHFGQPTSRRSPKMDEFVFGINKAGMQIIDLNLTWAKIQEAGKTIQKLTSEDKNIVFVGTNERAVSSVLAEYSEKYELHNIVNRWLGGTLTNPVTRSRINYLKELEGMEQSGFMDSISAKEKSFLNKKLKKLKKSLGGLTKIKGAMHAMVIVDPVHEVNATLEALKKSRNLTIIAIADTNCHFSPDLFDVVIPCNTNSLRSLRLVMDELMHFVETGRQNKVQKQSSSISVGPKRGAQRGNLPRKPVTVKKQASDAPKSEVKAAEPKAKEVKNESKNETKESKNEGGSN